MKHKLSFLVVILFCTISIAQNLNQYKYIVLPEKYDFLKTEGQFKLVSLTKFLFEKENFTILNKSDKMPNDLYENPCLGMYVDVIQSSSFLATALEIEIKDCRKEIILKSKKGKSKLKEYKRSYHEALRDAFISFNNLNYAYEQVKVVNNIKTTKPKEIKKELTINAVSTHVTVTTQDNIVSNSKKETLYAQKINNGFQLVDSSPQVLYTLLNTNKKNVYILNNKKGYLYKKDLKWIVEYYENGNLITEILEVKF